MALEVYKPSGRNLFSLSMGIPSILLPYVRCAPLLPPITCLDL
jgi:hypothetical protein